MNFSIVAVPKEMRVAMALLVVWLAAAPVVAQQAAAYQDTKLSFEERARDMESRMTLEEKVSQLGHTSDAIERLGDRKSTRLNSSHVLRSRMPSSA